MKGVVGLIVVLMIYIFRAEISFVIATSFYNTVKFLPDLGLALLPYGYLLVGAFVLWAMGFAISSWNEGSQGEILLFKTRKIINTSRKVLLMLIVVCIAIIPEGSMVWHSVNDIIPRDFGLSVLMATDEANVTLLAKILIEILCLVEAYWICFKVNTYLGARKSCCNEIDYFRRASDYEGKFMIKSTWSTPYCESGNYYWEVDYNPETGNWDHIEMHCVS